MPPRVRLISMESSIMKQELKNKWVEALRSGDYQQGRSVLRSHDDKFCCLGVLCDIASKDGILDHEWVAPNSVANRDRDWDDKDPFMFNGRQAIIGQDVRDELGMTLGLYPLTTKNDGVLDLDNNPIGRPWSFDQIADFIEANERVTA